jgi:methylglutaconyl-CoA hydratase
VNDAGGDGGETAPLVAIEEGPVTTIALDSPQNRNALSARLVAELHEALQVASADPEVRAIVLTGTGSVFCSGADLSERRLANPPNTTAAMAEVFTQIATAPKPVVARVNGHVRAGGIGLVTASDLAVAPEGATFAFSEVRVGVVPAMIAVPALRVLTPRALSAYALTGETFDAPQAQAIGLINAVVEVGGLDDWVGKITMSLLAGAPGALATTKALLGELRFQPWDAALDRASRVSAEVFASAEAQEGMSAFLEKRPPAWVKAP